MENSNNPLISVVVPVYKVEPYLEKCVESILAQTYSNLEIILVDDGSPDNCGKICDNFKQKDPRVCVIHKSNGGLSSARNAGIEIAHGEYIGFVDSDDTIEPYMYEKLYHAIERDNTELAVCAVNYVYEDGKILKKPGLGKDAIFNFSEAMIEMNLHRMFDMATWSKLYHRNLYDDLRFPIGKLSEDYYVMFRILDRAQRVSYVDTRCYNYLQRKNSVTRSNKINHDHEYAALEQMEYLEKNYPELNVVGHVAYASAALTVYDSYLKNKVPCPKQKLDHFKSVVQENKEYIKKAEFLPRSKQVQFKLFGLSTLLYNAVFKTYRKIKRI